MTHPLEVRAAGQTIPAATCSTEREAVIAALVALKLPTRGAQITLMRDDTVVEFAVTANDQVILDGSLVRA
ncbi:hypothetical protein [Deinococcus marmoris]|uniref:hypothetical protein n=1 Tax=Deinococcus marmoris TaxID=249408 RepID=UPI00096A7080|nr:hypothetical protein [Deinococcus marmoris]